MTAGPLEDRTEDARRFLACLDDIVSQSSFSVGIAYVAEVLFGSVSAKVMRLGHEKLKTYGSGKLNNKPEWTHVGKELVRLGYLRQSQDGLPVLSITNSGRGPNRSTKSVRAKSPSIRFSWFSET